LRRYEDVKERTGFEEAVEDLDRVVEGRVVQGGVSVVVLGLDAGPVLQQQQYRLDSVVGRTEPRQPPPTRAISLTWSRAL
jgi:hypothetical protein